MKTKNILILVGVIVLAGLVFFGFRYRKKRIVYKGEEIAQEQVASVLQQTLQSDELKALLRKKMESPDKKVQDQAHQEFIFNEFQSLYELNNFEPLWLGAEGPKPVTEKFLQLIKESPKEGLPVELYQIGDIENTLQSVYPLDKDEIQLEELIEGDFNLSIAAIRYGIHLRFGLIDPTRAAKFWKAYPETEDSDMAKFVYNAIHEENIENSFQSLIPKSTYYQKMKKALQEIESREAPENLSADIKLNKGDSGENVAGMKALLAYHGFSASAGNSFDAETEESIKSFQLSRGMKPDGVVSSGTIKELNITGDALVDKLRLNLERSRWVSEDDHFLLVNIPEYKVRIYKNGKPEIEMKVIVGKEYTSTPVFTDTMEHIIFSPTWGVPYSIASKEMLPILKRDASYLSRNNYKLYRGGKEVSPSSVDWGSVSESAFNYQIVQSPGSGNALGHVKFMFPNSMNIYLHDTPTDHLFNRETRMFSHGCIRVEKPAELAEYLLKPTGDWPMDKIKSHFGMSSPKQVNLEEKLPVQIFYMTAWVDESGKINLRDDIYGHDKTQMELLRNALNTSGSAVADLD